MTYILTRMNSAILVLLWNVILNHLDQLKHVSGVEVPTTNRQQFTQFTLFKCDNIPVCAISQPSESFSVVSKAQCVLYCQQRRQQSCVGVNYKEQTNTCDVFNYAVGSFKKNVTGCQYFQKGIADPLDCLHINPRDCNDVWYLTGKTQNANGVYTVFVGNDERPLSVYCEMNTTGGWTVFQRRQDGSVDFYRNWADYSAGFGNPNGEFWIGNDNLNLLTTAKRYKLRIDLADFNNNTRYAEYDNFIVNSAADGYRLSSLGTYSGTAGDSLADGNQLGHKFSTFDRNNAICQPGSCTSSPVGNCAVTYRGAWWYSDCHTSNLNGFFYGGPHTSNADGVEWSSWTGFKYSLKSSMKIKPFN